MHVRPLVCSRCAGALPNPVSLPALIECLFCGTVNAVTAGEIHASPVMQSWDARREAIAAFTGALVAGLGEGLTPFDALRVASGTHLGEAGHPDTIARIVLALGSDFDRVTGVSVVRDPVALSRLAQAYLLALDALRERDDYDLNLPFLAVGAAGPVHLRRTLTPALLIELAARSPGSSAPKASTAEPAKKKGWWPFG